MNEIDKLPREAYDTRYIQIGAKATSGMLLFGLAVLGVFDFLPFIPDVPTWVFLPVGILGVVWFLKACYKAGELNGRSLKTAFSDRDQDDHGEDPG